ncbi:MAG: hypothetical protein IPI41_09595 [Flavobacteriales bacterium]|nr:hypothetical protein [Flavobacteriales bacterium]
MLTDPDYQQRVADFNDRAERFDVNELRGGGTLFVPVVVHVMDIGTALPRSPTTRSGGIAG